MEGGEKCQEKMERVLPGAHRGEEAGLRAERVRGPVDEAVRDRVRVRAADKDLAVAIKSNLSKRKGGAIECEDGVKGAEKGVSVAQLNAFVRIAARELPISQEFLVFNRDARIAAARWLGRKK